mgnify:FL=1
MDCLALLALFTFHFRDSLFDVLCFSMTVSAREKAILTRRVDLAKGSAMGRFEFSLVNKFSTKSRRWAARLYDFCAWEPRP